jgi:hypothetical protein
MSSRLLIKVDLDWSGPGHYDPSESKPCGSCGHPTKMRDNRGEPFHHSCAEQAVAQELLGLAGALIPDERFGYTEQELADELLGATDDTPRAGAEAERIRPPAAVLADSRGGAR